MNVDKYIGLPYADKGRDFNGADCWGLVRLVYLHEYGIALPSYTEKYASSVEAREIALLIGGEKGAWETIPVGEEREGDMIIVRLLGHPMHVGVICGHKRMLHLLKGTNAVEEDYSGTLWRNRIVYFLRHEEMR